MTKRFGIYSIIWAIALAVFNVIVFIVPSEVNEVSRLTGSFWVAYVFITVAFVGQLLCTFFALKPCSHQKLFYRIPLITVSLIGLGVMLLCGVVFMIVPVIPYWVGVIVCVLVLAINIIAVIKASVVAGIVGGIDDKIKVSTSFMNALASEAYSLMSSAEGKEMRTLAEKVYEAIRYSDYTSCTGLEESNAQLKKQFSAFEQAVRENDTELAKSEEKAFNEALIKRNELCKSLK